MNVFYHFSSVLLSNTYLVGPEGGGDAILIDPGEMDAPLLRLIEGNGYYIRAILITRGYPTQVHGVRTLLKIYNAKLYSNSDRIYDCRCRRVSDGEHLFVAGFEVEVMDLLSGEPHPVVYRIEDFLFTGPLFTAGNIVAAPSRGRRRETVERIISQILALPCSVLILPGAGPPSSVRAERAVREKTNE